VLQSRRVSEDSKTLFFSDSATKPTPGGGGGAGSCRVSPHPEPSKVHGESQMRRPFVLQTGYLKMSSGVRDNALRPDEQKIIISGPAFR